MSIAPSRVRVLFTALVLSSVLAACGGGTASTTSPTTSDATSPLSIDSITFARDDNGQPGATVTAFKVTDRKLYAKATLSRVELGAKGKAVWTAVTTSAGNDIKIAEVAFESAVVNTITSDLSMPTDWPTGTYRVDFYLKDQLIKSAEFQIS